MPIKYNLTKYDVLVDRIHKVVLKEQAHQNGNDKADPQDENDGSDDEAVKLMAVLVASFSSGHSWQTHKAITERIALNLPEIKDEFAEAAKTRWKEVSHSDLAELANNRIPDSIFAQWLFFNVDKEIQEGYKGAWQALSKEMSEGVDEVSAEQRE
jgi:hypothetical protein